MSGKPEPGVAVGPAVPAPLVLHLGWDTSTPCIKGEVQKQVNCFQVLPLTAPVCLGLSRSWCFLFQCLEVEPSFRCLLSPGAAAAPYGMLSAVPEGVRCSVRCWGQCRGGSALHVWLGNTLTLGSPRLLLQCKQQVLVIGSSEDVSSVVHSQLCRLMPAPALSHRSELFHSLSLL